MKKYFPVNPSAESICDTVAVIFLTVFIICSVIALIAGLAMESFFIGILGAILFVIVGLVSWASLKVIVNISRSLYNITETLQEVYFPAGSESPQTIVSSDANNGCRFSIGQLVIVKNDERQFRISSINEDGYYSEKFDNTFTEDEIEDFDAYWAEKKK